MLSTPNINEIKLNNSENNQNSNNKKLYELKNSGSKVHFGNKIYKLTEEFDDIPAFHRNCIFVFFYYQIYF